MARLQHPMALLSSRYCLTPSYPSSSPNDPPPYCPLPPPDFSPISILPSEVLINIFSFLTIEDHLILRQVSSRWGELAMSPDLHRTLHMYGPPWSRRGGEGGRGVPPALFADILLPSVRHLWIHTLPNSGDYPIRPSCRTSRSLALYGPLSSLASPAMRVIALLSHVPPNRLISFGLPMSREILKEDILGVIAAAGTNLQRLYLSLSSLDGAGALGLRHLDDLRVLDLSYTSIDQLPLPAPWQPAPWANLRELSLRFCSGLKSDNLTLFLAWLPARIENLDLSKVPKLEKKDLMGMRVVWDGRPTALRAVDVTGVEHLTRKDIREIKAHWEGQRLACFPASPVPSLRGRGWQAGEFSPATPPTPASVLSPSGSPPEQDPAYLSSSPASLCGGYSHHHPDYHRRHPAIPPTPPAYLSPPTTPIRLPHSPTYSHPPLPDPFAAPVPDISIQIVHSARLESDDEDGYRQFIGEVAGGTVGSATSVSVSVGAGAGAGCARQGGSSVRERGMAPGEFWEIQEEMGMRLWRSRGQFEVM